MGRGTNLAGLDRSALNRQEHQIQYLVYHGFGVCYTVSKSLLVAATDLSPRLKRRGRKDQSTGRTGVCMLYDSTKVLLSGILRSLESAGKIGWEDQLELAGECSYEVHQMARLLYKGYRTDSVNKAPMAVPVAERAARAVPHVKSLVRAIRRKDQVAAVESGKAALAEM